MPNGFTNRIGVTIEEGIANATSTSSGINTRNIGMLTERVRGVANKPTLITSLREDKQKFGENDPNKYSSYVIENLFNNAGGYPVNLYQVRIVGTGSVASSVLVKQGTDELITFTAGQEGLADVGDWGNDLKVRIHPMGATGGSSDGYLLQVFYKDYLVENFTSVGKDFKNLAEQVNQRSNYLMAEVGSNYDVDITAVINATLIGGVYNSPVETDFYPTYTDVTFEPKGMALFDNADVQILACPEVFSTEMSRRCDEYARTNLKFFIFNMPYLANETQVASYYTTLATPDQSFSAGYLEWVQVPLDDKGNRGWIPQLGYILGAGYIRKAGLNNGAVWTPPAGVETYAKGIYAFTHRDLNDDRRSRYVKVHRCNVTQYVNNVGFCSWSSRTYSTNQLFESIHVRLETNWMVKNVEQNNAKWMQKILSPSMQKSAEYDNLIWYKNLYEMGGIEQSIPFDEAVIVEFIVDKNNRKEAELHIAWIPPECLEHLHIRVNRNDGILVSNF